MNRKKRKAAAAAEQRVGASFAKKYMRKMKTRPRLKPLKYSIFQHQNENLRKYKLTELWSACNIVPEVYFQDRLLSPVNSKNSKSITNCNHDYSLESFYSQHTRRMKLFKNSLNIPETMFFIIYISCRYTYSADFTSLNKEDFHQISIYTFITHQFLI